jgi:hypothetical protein
MSLRRGLAKYTNKNHFIKAFWRQALQRAFFFLSKGKNSPKIHLTKGVCGATIEKVNYLTVNYLIFCIR